MYVSDSSGLTVLVLVDWGQSMYRTFFIRSALIASGCMGLAACTTLQQGGTEARSTQGAGNVQTGAPPIGNAGTAATGNRSQTRDANRESGSQRASGDQIQIVRYIGGSTTNWPRVNNSSQQLNMNTGFADLYTRFVLFGPDTIGVQNPPPPPSPQRRFRNYRAERPTWLARIFSEEERSVVAVARISVLNPSLQMTVPLYSVSYNSGGSSGEAWATAITSSYVRSPLFRVTGNSRFSLNVTTNTSDATQSSGFSTAISALTGAIELVAPEAGLLTTLSEDTTKSRATALDSAISDLLSYSISEEIEFGRMINSWEPGALIQLDGCAPFVRGEGDAPRWARSDNVSLQNNVLCANDRDLDGRQNNYVGSWRLVLTCPQFSIFSPRTICDSDNKIVDISTLARRNAINGEIALLVADSLVLEEPMGENATIRSLVRGGDFFIAFVDVADPDATQYGRFCASTLDVLRQSGLTGVDSALGLRATLRLMPEFVADSVDSGKMATCTRLLASYGVAL